MEGYDANLRTLEAVVAVFQDVLKAELVELRRKRNTTLPISKLPLETMVAIFQKDLNLTWNVSKVDQRPERVGTLSSVSKAWNSIVQLTPCLWSELYTNYPPRFIQAAVERSGQHELTVGGELTEKNPRLQEAALAVCSQICRWSSAKFVADSDAALDLLTYSPGPMLQTLVVTCLQTDNSTPISTNLFDGKAPQLKHVALARLQAVWESPIFTGLRTLTLFDVLGLARSQFLAILHACPLLLHLVLHDLQLIPSDPTSPEERSPISLLNLERLHVRDCAVEVLQDISTNIDCPSANEVVFTIPSSSQHTPPVAHLATLQPVIAFAIKFLQRRIAKNTLPHDLIWRTTSYCFSFGGQAPDRSRLWLANAEND